MKGKAKIIAIVAVVMAMIIGTITYGVITTVNAKGVFGEDGYVLGNISNGDSQRADRSLYFLAGDKYQKNIQTESYSTKRRCGCDHRKESFVHFMNNDLLSFSDGVFWIWTL